MKNEIQSYLYNWLIIFEKKINMLSELEQIRREKLNKLKELGINPFPAALFPINTNSSEIISNYEENKKVTIAGRLMSRRIQGKASFAEIQDSKGKVQVYFNRDEICQGDDKTIYNENILTHQALSLSSNTTPKKSD